MLLWVLVLVLVLLWRDMEGRQMSGSNGEEGPAGETQYVATTWYCWWTKVWHYIAMDQPPHLESHCNCSGANEHEQSRQVDSYNCYRGPIWAPQLNLALKCIFFMKFRFQNCQITNYSMLLMFLITGANKVFRSLGKCAIAYSWYVHTPWYVHGMCMYILHGMCILHIYIVLKSFMGQDQFW